jgi:Phage portal protein, SPP1 Gp6-like
VSVVAVEPSADDTLGLVEEQRDRLLRKLSAQRVHAANLWAWYHGDQPGPAVVRKYADAYRLLLDLARTPWARLVVDTIAERLRVQGFSSADGTDVSDAAWTLFQRSQMNADEWLVYTESLITGDGYVSVSSGEAGSAIAPESAFEVTHEPYPGRRRTVAGALKMYPLDWTGRHWATELYRPEARYLWTTELPRPPVADDTSVFPIDSEFSEDFQWDEGDPFVTDNPSLVVPIVPFENRATVLGGGVSELEDCLPVLRRIDKLTLDKMLTSEFAAFRQKWATGLEVPRDPETGNPIEPFKAAVDRLWVNEKPDGRFGTFEASDLGPYLTAIDAEIAALAAISRVPSHYLLQQNLANPPSAESLVASESGLVAKVEERQRRFGEAWERALRLGLELDGVETSGELETAWADAEMRNPAQVADAAVKLSTIGVPQRALWEYIGATPQQIQAWTLEAAGAELAAAAAAPLPTP